MIHIVTDSENAKIGNDLIHLPTFEKSLNPIFIKKVYDPIEIEYCQRFKNPNLRYASTFAAKEAVFKVIKQFLPDLTLPWRKIVISREGISGKPTVEIKLTTLETHTISLTISHDNDYVWAIASTSFNSF